MSKARILSTAVQQTHLWIRDVEAGLSIENEHSALAACRATLHAMRDRLPAVLVAHLAAQLPTLLRGIFYEGWNPSITRRRHSFLLAVRSALKDHAQLGDTERTVRAVFAALAAHVSPGEIEKVARALPQDARSLWPSPPAEVP
jgi:uncharacterized protein (DUF2267 family)